MQGFDPQTILPRIAAQGLERQEIRPGDWFDDDGMLMYHIGEAVDAVQQVMLDHGFDIRRPYIEDDGKHRTVHEYERAGAR